MSLNEAEISAEASLAQFAAAQGAWGLLAASAGLCALAMGAALHDVAGGLAIALAPGALSALLASRAQRAYAQGLVLFAWTACACVLCLASGAVASPALGLFALPAAFGYRMGGARLAVEGAGLSAIGCAAIIALAMPGAPPPADFGPFAGLLSMAAIGQAGYLFGIGRGAGILREALTAPYVWLDPGGRILDLSRGARALQRVRLLKRGALFSDLAHEADRARLEGALAAAYRGAPFVMEARLWRASGGYAWTQIHARRAGGGALRLGLRDIDVWRAALDRERAERASLEAKALARERFLGVLAHEMRTPLNAIEGFSDIMRQGLFGPLSERYLDYLRIIAESGRHLTSLADGILDLARAQAGMFRLRPEPFAPETILRQAVDWLAPAAEGAKVRVDLASHCDGEFVGDPQILRQIAINLIGNSVKFSPEGAQIQVFCEGERDHMILEVRDFGPGIAPEELTRLGEAFEQGEAGIGKGAGLGLYIVRSLARLHGGDLTIHSAPGAGSRFIVRLAGQGGAQAA